MLPSIGHERASSSRHDGDLSAFDPGASGGDVPLPPWAQARRGAGRDDPFKRHLEHAVVLLPSCRYMLWKEDLRANVR